MVKQSLSTGELNICKTVLSNVRRILESDYIGMIQRKLRDEAPRTAGQVKPSTVTTHPQQLAGLSGPEEERLRKFIVYLNSLSVSIDYEQRILSSVDVNVYFPFESDAKDIKNVLDSLSASISSRCSELINDGLQVLYTTVLNVRIRNMCTSLFREANYMLSPNDESQLSEQFAQRWRVFIREFIRIMSPENYGRLLTIITSSMSRLFEKWIWSLEGKVNDLGAIALDRDVSRIIGCLSEGHYRVREKFVRVAQIVMIAGLDDPEEEAAMDIVLSEEERVRARAMRVERR
jgi:hypothetical protein